MIERTPLELTRLSDAVFCAIWRASPMSRDLKDAAGAVLVDGVALTAAAESADVPPSVLARACKALLRYVPRADDEPLTGPAGAFVAWAERRLEAAADVVTARGVPVPAMVRASELRADLAAFEPDVNVPRVTFGRLMRERGVRSHVVGGVTWYLGVRIVGTHGNVAKTQRRAPVVTVAPPRTVAVSFKPAR